MIFSELLFYQVVRQRGDVVDWNREHVVQININQNKTGLVFFWLSAYQIFGVCSSDLPVHWTTFKEL